MLVTKNVPGHASLRLIFASGGAEKTAYGGLVTDNVAATDNSKDTLTSTRQID